MTMAARHAATRKRPGNEQRPEEFVADQARLDELKSGFRNALRHIPRNQPLLYLDYPVHLNVGDLLILKGVEAAFLDAGFDVCGRYGWMNFRPSGSAEIDRETPIVFHGGGNFGDLYPIHQNFRERMLMCFPRNRIVILPQTIHFSSQAELDASARCFRRHPNVLIMVRDRPSFDIARRHFSDQVQLVPDAAHYLWRQLPATAVRGAAGTAELQLLRSDKEAIRLTRHPLRDQQASDWIDLIPRWSHHLFGLVCRLHAIEGFLDRDLHAQSAWYRQSDLIVRHMIRTFSQFGSIRSDRLHACLLGILLGKPVMPLDNSYGKLRHYFDAWFDNTGYAKQERYVDA